MESRGELGLNSFVVSKGMGMGITEDRRGPSGKILPGLKMDLEEALRRLREVFAAKGVVLAYLFGSYAEGTATPKTDLDIAVLVEGGDLYESYGRFSLLFGRRWERSVSIFFCLTALLYPSSSKSSLTAGSSIAGMRTCSTNSRWM